MSNVATREAYGKALEKYGVDNEKVVVLDADLSKSTKTAVFQKACPERFFNMGIAEQNLAGVAAGLATTGKIPFISTFAMFGAGRAFEIIRNSIAYPKLNVKICATHAGLTVGPDGASHQAIEDISLMRSVPNMVVINPADAESTDKLVKAIIEYNGPVYMRLGRSGVPVIYDENTTIEIGKGIVVKEGTDVSIIATGIMVNEAIKASEELKKENINAEVIDIHTIKPLDEKLIIETAKKTGKVVVAEEHNIIGGLGSAVAEVLSENYPTKIKRVGVKDTFGESGSPADLVKKYGLTSEEIIKACKGF